MDSSFTFSASQLDDPMTSVFGGASFEKLGITRKTYQLCERFDSNYRNTWDEKVNTSFLAYYGYDHLDDFKSVYAKARIFNTLRFLPNKTIKEFMELYSRKVKSREVDSSNTSNVVDFLMSMTLEEMLCVGW